ncbi:hypothetical protein AB0L34_34305, partial [Micromonospora sp. NPDC052213]
MSVMQAYRLVRRPGGAGAGVTHDAGAGQGVGRSGGPAEAEPRSGGSAGDAAHPQTATPHDSASPQTGTGAGAGTNVSRRVDPVQA